MPKDPEGRKRPADVIGNAVHIMRLATGQIEEKPVSNRAKGGKAGGAARAKSLSSDARKAIAHKGAKKRWESGSDS